MKKNLFVVAAVALLAAVSCNKELPQDHPVGESVTFEAMVDGADTRTVLDGKVSKWSGEEWIQVVGSKAYWFGTEKIQTPTDRAIFSYNGDNGEFTETADIMAVYPAGSKAYTFDSADQTVSGVSVKTSQSAVEGSYDKDAALMVAYADAKDGTLQFKNVPALLKFTMGSDNIGKVTVWGTVADGSNAIVSGAGSVRYNEGEPVFTPAAVKDGGAAYVELLDGDKFSKGGVYYIAVAPGQFKSITVEFDGIPAKSKTFDTPYEISRNKILDLGTIESQSTGRVIVGSTDALGNWNAGSGVQFVDGADYYEAKNVTLTGSEEFKLVIDGGWYSSSVAVKTGAWLSLVDGANMKLSAGTYDFYLTKDATAKLYIAVSGSAEPLAPGIIPAEEGWIYLKPNSNWTQAGARFAIYLCNGSKSAKWVSLSNVEGTSYYGVKLPDDYTVANYKNIIFVRMNPANNTNDWNNKWNQTGDLLSSKILTDKNNCCAINSGQWDAGSNVTWSKITQLN